MNILLLFPHFNPPELSSNLRSWEIGGYLAKQGHNVTVFAPGVNMRTGELFPELRGKLYKKSYINDVTLIRTRTLTRFRGSPLRRIMFEFIYAFLVFLRSLFLSKIDIVVVSYPPAMMPIFGLIIGKIKRVPLIFEVRDLMAEFLLATGYVKSSMFIKLALQIEKYVAKSCDYIIAVTPGIKRILLSKGILSNKITIVTNGYEQALFSQADYSINARSEFGWDNKFVVVYAGGLTQSYDIPTLLRAACRLKHNNEVLFVII